MQLKGIMLASLLTFTCSTLYANNEWTSHQGNASHTGYVEITTNPANYHQIWERKLGASSLLVPRLPNHLIIKGLAFYDVDAYPDTNTKGLPLEHKLLAVSTNTGRTRWEKNISTTMRDVGLHYVGGKIIQISTGPDTARAKAYHPQTGKPVYSLLLPERAYLTEADKTNLYVIYSGKQHMIGSINAQTRKTNWLEPELDRYVRGFAVNNAYTLTQYHDGGFLHNRDTGTYAFGFALGGVWFPTTMARYPVIDGKKEMAYFMYLKHPGDPRPENVYLFAHDLKQNGVVRWELPMQSATTNPVVAGNEVYSTEYDNTKLNAVNAVTGKILWTWRPQNDVINPDSPPVATMDVIFVVGAKNTYAVSRATHETVWKIDRVGSLAMGDHKLFIHSNKNNSYDYVTAIELN